jgi:hypothetical protein
LGDGCWNVSWFLWNLRRLNNRGLWHFLAKTLKVSKVFLFALLALSCPHDPAVDIIKQTYIQRRKHSKVLLAFNTFPIICLTQTIQIKTISTLQSVPTRTARALTIRILCTQRRLLKTAVYILHVKTFITDLASSVLDLCAVFNLDFGDWLACAPFQSEFLPAPNAASFDHYITEQTIRRQLPT